MVGVPWIANVEQVKKLEEDGRTLYLGTCGCEAVSKAVDVAIWNRVRNVQEVTS
jgi:anthranilate/para-aminobenzoate synthase component I